MIRVLSRTDTPLLDNLLTFHLPGKGFRHTADGNDSNQMATEQAFYGMIAAQRARNGKPGLYQMRDALVLGDGSHSEPARGAGLAGKVPAVKAAPVTKPDIRFTDILLSDQAAAIEQLAVREILTGKGNGRFDPDAGMTRAEFAAIVVRALGLTPVTSGAFSDVAADKWYAPYIGTATSYGIIQGVSNGRFNPEGSVSRQEAAVMLARAASCCGMDTTLDTAAVRDILAPFADYVTTAEWSRAGLAFCYSTGILDDAALDIQGSPQHQTLRNRADGIQSVVCRQSLVAGCEVKCDGVEKTRIEVTPCTADRHHAGGGLLVWRQCPRHARLVGNPQAR